MNHRPVQSGTLKFLVVAIVFMVLLDRLWYSVGTPSPQEGARQEIQVPVRPLPEGQEEQLPPLPGEIAGQPDAIPQPLPDSPPDEAVPAPVPAWKKFAVPVTVPPGTPTITIIIDDLGEDRAHTKEIIALPGPLTAAFLPYPAHVEELVEEARGAGHEIMVHMPMEAEDADLDPGAYVLRSSMIPGTFETVLEDNLSKFGGYVGINNHMGSRLTQDPEAMRIVMAHLFSRGLLFVDSRTIGSSVAEKAAADYGVPHAARDVFLDNEPDEASVLGNLEKVEKMARQRGHAIAIGHPKRGTIDALKKWLPTLAEKGFILVPVSARAITGTAVSEN